MDIQQLFQCYGIPLPTSEAKQDTAEGSRREEGTKSRSYIDVLESRGEEVAEPLIKPLPPVMEGGNIAVVLDEGEYLKGIEENKFNVLGRLTVQRGAAQITTLDLKDKLSKAWGFTNFKVIPVGRGFFHVTLASMSDQSSVMSNGTVNLKPGMFRVSQWVPDFNPNLQRQTNAQVWMRIYDLPLEYWRPSNLFCIARGAGLPLKIDERTLAKENGLYARILVDADLAEELPEKILVKRRQLNFFVKLKYEKLPGICFSCGTIGHTMEECRKQAGGSFQSLAKPVNKLTGQLDARTVNNGRINATAKRGTQVPTRINNAAGTERTAAPNEQVRLSNQYSVLSNVLEEVVPAPEQQQTLQFSGETEGTGTPQHDTRPRGTGKSPRTQLVGTENVTQSDSRKVERSTIEKEIQSTSAPACPQAGERGKDKEATTSNDRPGIGGIGPLDMLNLIQLSTQPLALPKAKHITSSKAQGKNIIALGYATDTRGEHEDDGGTGIESGGEDFSYYMTRQAKKAANRKQTTGFKMRVRMGGT